MKKLTVLFLVACFTLSFARGEGGDEHTAEKQVLREKIETYLTKIEDLNEDIERNRTEIITENGAYELYKESFESDVAWSREELERLETEKVELRGSSDSTSREIARVRYKRNEFALKQTNFKLELIASLGAYEDQLEQLPPVIANANLNALRFLIDEISANNVGNGEGLERFWQITQTVSSDRSAIDTWAANSTFDNILGNAHYLRIGYAWLACVDEDATTAAYWDFETSQWIEISRPDFVLEIRTAVKIRNGNSIPQLINLPIAHAPLEEASDVE